ncbi:transferase CAF17, mitochondrial X3 [Biomphalaria glabrata]|nr:transferase CAF17, mitochondrial X3 [Biomphalaria glabrata]
MSSTNRNGPFYSFLTRLIPDQTTYTASHPPDHTGNDPFYNSGDSSLSLGLLNPNPQSTILTLLAVVRTSLVAEI